METMAILTETQIPQGEQRTDEVFSIHAGDFLEIIPPYIIGIHKIG